MIDIVKKFFSGTREPGAAEIREKEPHDIRVATCALLLEMAHIDGEFSDSEKDHILTHLEEDYGLSGDLAEELIEAAKEELKGSVDLWQFTNLVNQNYAVDEKLKIIEMIWKLAYVDGNLDKHEDYLLHKLAKLLRLSHKQLIDAKLKVVHALNPEP